MSAYSNDPALVLKATPPRAINGFQERERLSFGRVESSGSRVAVLLAPAGFGKTAQLVHWRRENLAMGSLAFWLTADEHDEPHRFVQGLAYAARELSGRRGFGASFFQWLNTCSDPMLAITGWLAEVSSLSVNVLLVIDEAERMPPQTRTEYLAYLVGNAPANLHIAIGARPSGAMPILNTLSRSRITVVATSEMRFSPDETAALLSHSLGKRFTPDLAIELHELVEGWPLGVRMAISALQGESSPQNLLAMATRDIRDYFVGKLIDQQPAETLQMLVLMADFEVIHPELCAHALGTQAQVHELTRLRDETPLFTIAEGSEWMRFHPIARDCLRERLKMLPHSIRAAIATAASAWYAEHNLFQEAAQLLRTIGDQQGALRMVERSMRVLIAQGRSAAIIEWVQHCSHSEIEQHPDFWLPAAWAYTMSERPSDAQPLLELAETHPAINKQDRFELDLIRSAAGAYSDDFDRQSQIPSQWNEPPPEISPHALPIFWAAKGIQALQSGKSDQARLHFGKVARLDRNMAYTPSAYGFVDVGIALTYLWEGRYTLAERALRPAAARAQERMDRRSPVACSLATLLGTVCWEQGYTEEAQTLLALRLDVIEQHGLPDVLMAGYRTAAGIADASGRQDEAIALLEALSAHGEVRGMIRLRAVAQLEIAKLHVRHGRPETAEKISHELNLLVNSQPSLQHPAFAALLRLTSDLARAHAGLALGGTAHLHSALEAAQGAMSLADGIKRGAEGIEARILRAHAMRRLGYADARLALDDAVSLAAAAGMDRFVAGLNPSQGKATASSQPHTSTVAAVSPTDPSSIRISGSALLTTKERDALLGLVRGLSNKEIAQSMGVSEQTIKWHMKNLFSKLSASSRKHAVARANLLGLITR